MNNYKFLEKIIEYKQHWINCKEKKFPLKKIQKQVIPSKRNFYCALSQQHTVFILECKKATPNKGIIKKNFNINIIIKTYKNYATAISIVTDEKYFHGDFNFLKQASKISTKPILCKDFIISPWQIFFARLHKADAILLILSILSNDMYNKLTNIAHDLNMGVLTEITNHEEWERAIMLNAKIIGINNRNLHNLSIDLNTTINLANKRKEKNLILISESGIKYHQHIRKLKKYVNGFLIGTALMSAPNLNTAIRKLLIGENKVCGLTNIYDAYHSYECGALYGGLIFINSSPRCIDVFTAQKIINSVPYLLFVGVFQNSPIINVSKIAHILKLYAVQLHGKENQIYINKLKQKLPKFCKIWKSIDVNNVLKKKYMKKIHRYILDNETGGTGKSFNWELINNITTPYNIIIAGGLKESNCANAIKLGFLGLDFNSGIEKKPGIKNHKTLKKVFQIITSI